ncbi:MAG: Uncharacterized protein XD43_0731 [Thermococcales archaeon 44_46]|nr:MAG: Uncharacterized protein XD43_0731 [Thermococcales archaeon 44_46]HIH72423.1 hypothetical protein [Thermococcaceae archaeon]
MIWGIIAVIGGLILGAKAIVLIPLVYLLARKSKDLGLIAYFFYALLLMNEVFVEGFLSFEAVKAILLGVLPSLMILKEVLVGAYKFEKPEIKDFIDVKIGLFVLAILVLMAILKLRYEYLYTIENQTSLVAGLAVIFVLLNLRKEIKGVEMFKVKEGEI